MRRFWVIDSSDVVAKFVRKWPFKVSKSRALFSFDFEKMYTKLPHPDLIEKIALAVREALDIEEASIIEVSDNGAFYRKHGTTSHAGGIHYMDTSEIEKLLTFVISNTYLHNGDFLVRQILGIPMGTNSGPKIANLYLYWYESNFIDRLLQNKDFSIAQEFHISFRLIDDLLSLTNPAIVVFVAVPYPLGIYPKELSLKRTNASCSEADFAGLLLRDQNEMIITSLFDKRQAFPFPVVRNQHPSSTIPSSVIYGVYTSQLHRFAVACTLFVDFKTEALDYRDYLVEKDYSLRRLNRLLAKFFIKHGVPLYKRSLSSLLRPGT